MRGAQRPLLAEVMFGEEEGEVRGRAIEEGRGMRREVGGGGGRVWDREVRRRKKKRRMLLLMQRDSGGSCMVPEPVRECHTRSVL